MSPTASQPPARRPVSLGVIFLTLYIDLIGFSIIFPLAPDLLTHYLQVDGHTGALGWLLSHLDAVAHALGKESNFAAVLFGGVVSSIFSILQFIFAPFWGAVSDRHGRRHVLTFTIVGTALGYLVWIFSGSFWWFLISRLVSGAFSGNLSVATAAVADVTTREERSRAMGLVGAAFGLGLMTGPMLGAAASHFNLLARHPGLARFGINPFSIPAATAFVLCIVNLFWVTARFNETLSPAARAGSHPPRLRNPISAILGLENRAVRRTNFVAFVFSLAFVSMETSITFLAAERFDYTARQNGILLGFLGVCAIITQGYIVRKLLQRHSEIGVLSSGLGFAAAGLLLIGFAPHPWALYAGLAVLALGSGLVNPSTSGLISLYSDNAGQGRALGIFRSLGSLSRAITPVLAGAAYWIFGSTSVFVAAAAFALASLWLSRTLPHPEK